MADLNLEALQAALHQLHGKPAGAVLIAAALAGLALVVLRLAYVALHFFYVYALRPGRRVTWYGKWAVVTGATDGIGRAYCEELARKGMNLVLVSRTQSKLIDAAADLTNAHGVETRVCAADLCRPDDATFARLAAALEGLEVGLLVNNAGMSYDHPEYLDAIDDATVADIVNINAIAPTRLAKLVLPGMKARKRGAIVNIGSGVTTAMPACPLLSVYAGTKAYVDTFSRSLNVEYAGTGVTVQNQAPNFVATKMSKIRRPRLDAPSPAAWARAAVRQIGREPCISPYWFHGIQCFAVRITPAAIMNWYVMSLHQGFRRKAYQRQARDAGGAAAKKSK